MKKNLLLTIALLLLLPLSVIAQEYSQRIMERYTLGPKDRIVVSIFDRLSLDDPGRTFELTVQPNGTIVLPLLGEVRALGKTTAELKRELEQDLGQYMNEPIVQVQVIEYVSRTAAIVGAAQNQGVYTIESNTSLIRFIASSGGLAQDADPAAIIVFRANGDLIRVDLEQYFETGDLSQDIIVEHGDQVYIPRLQESWIVKMTRIGTLLSVFLQVIVLIVVLR